MSPKKGSVAGAAIAIIAIITTVPILSGAANAQTAGDKPLSITVSPPLNEIDSTPGQHIDKQVNLTNGSANDYTYNVVVQNFRANGEKGEADFTQEENQFSLDRWIKVTPRTVTIKAGETKSFAVSIEVPPNAPPGGRFGAVIFDPAPNPTQSAQVQVASRISSLFLLRIPGDVSEKASVASFDTNEIVKKNDNDTPMATSFFQKGPVDFGIRIRNDGNVQIKPVTTVTVYNIFGSKITTLHGDQQMVLPDSIRRTDVSWKHSTLFGYYKAKLDVKYGQNGQSIHSETSFWGAPIATIAIAVVILVALFLLLWLPRKRFKKALKALATSGE